MERKGGYSYQIEKIVTMEDLEVDYQQLQTAFKQAILDANKEIEENTKKQKRRNNLYNILVGIHKGLFWVETIACLCMLVHAGVSIYFDYIAKVSFNIDNLAYIVCFGALTFICVCSALKAKADDDYLMEFLNVNIAIIALIVALISLSKGGCGC